MENISIGNSILFTGTAAIISFIFCSILGGLTIATASLTYGWKKKKGFLEKYAQQILKMTLWFIIGYILIIAGGSLYLSKVTTHPIISFTLKGIISILKKNYVIALPFEGIFFCFFLCGFLYFLWDLFKGVKLLRVIIITFTTLSLWMCVYLITNSKVILFSKGLYALEQMAFSRLLIPSSEISIVLVLTYLALALGTGGANLSLFLILRRKRDDYGRDYYKYVVPLSCKWNMVFLFLIPLILLWILLVYRGHLPELYPLLYTAFLIAVLLCVIIGIDIKVIRSPQPLRLKEVLFISPVISLLIDGCIIYMLMMLAKEIILRA